MTDTTTASSGLTGLFFGAGASCEVGMPLVWELTSELKGWLTPNKLRDLNRAWIAQGGGHHDETIESLIEFLKRDDVHYEAALGFLETQSRRHRNLGQDYGALRVWFVQMIYHVLLLRHTNNVKLIETNLDHLEGVSRLAQLNHPLWIFSLNHDVIVECIAAKYGIPINHGFTTDIIRLPRRNVHGMKVGELDAAVLKGEQLEAQALPFLRNGERGINLLKLHGALDIFTFRNGKDMLKILPTEDSIAGVVESLRVANEELIYPDVRAPAGRVGTTNEIAYADDDNEMQFLRRTLVAGVHKFDPQVSQVLPRKLLDHLGSLINHVTTLICIGYGFGDLHVNRVIRDWLERVQERKLVIVGPDARTVPPFLLHLASQVRLEEATASAYLDRSTGIVRSKRDMVYKRFAAWARRKPVDGQAMLAAFVQEFSHEYLLKLTARLGALPRRNGDVDLSQFGLSAVELARKWRDELGANIEDILEAFLLVQDNGRREEAGKAGAGRQSVAEPENDESRAR